MSRAKAVKTVDDFIAEVNRCKAGRYYLGDDVSGNPNEPLSACICFDSARWEFYPKHGQRHLCCIRRPRERKTAVCE